MNNVTAGTMLSGRFVQKILLILSIIVLVLLFVLSPTARNRVVPLSEVLKSTQEPELPPRNIRSHNTDVNNTSVAVVPGRKKKILAWTRMFKMDFLLYHNSRVITSDQAFSQCPVYKNCEWTIDRSEAYNADALVFHFFPGDFKLDDLPSKRRPEQNWVHLNLEPPQRFQGMSSYHNHPMYKYGSANPKRVKYSLIAKFTLSH